MCFKAKFENQKDRLIMKNCLSIIFSTVLFFGLSSCTQTAKTQNTLPPPLPDSLLRREKEYTSLEEALAAPEKVYMLDLKGQGLDQLPESIGRLKYLQHLTLSENHLKRLPDSLVMLKNLQMILLRDNKGLDAHSTFKILKQIPYLRTVSLSNVDIEYLPKDVNEMDSLVLLNLSANPRIKIKDVVSFLANNTSLALLYLDKNKLQSLPNNIYKLKQIKGLYLSNNAFKSFPKALLKMTHLVALDLGNNPIKRLPESIKNLEKLETLYLYNTQIPTAELAKIQSWLPKTEIILEY